MRRQRVPLNSNTELKAISSQAWRWLSIVRWREVMMQIRTVIEIGSRIGTYTHPVSLKHSACRQPFLHSIFSLSHSSLVPLYLIPSYSTPLRIETRMSNRTKQLLQLLQSACVLICCLPRRDYTCIYPHDILLGDSG